MPRFAEILPTSTSYRWLPVFVLLVPTLGTDARTSANGADTHHAPPPPSVIRCSAASGSTANCVGYLPVGWKTQADRAQLFATMLAKIETSANELYGVRGGVVKNVQGGGQRWKMVEPLVDANLVDISDLKSPTVIGRLRHLRGANETMGNGLNKGDNEAFVVVYPDKFTEGPDVNDTRADLHASYRIVKLSFSAGGVPSIDIGQARRDFTPCHVNPDDESSALHPQRPNAQAQFATCASSMISTEEFASFFTMTVDSARKLTTNNDYNIIRRVALKELLQSYDAERERSRSVHGSFGQSNFLEWVGSEGLWFTCGLGCCYAKPRL